MKRFHFNLVSPEGWSPDELGCEFETLEAAYIEACRTIQEMGPDLMRRRADPSSHHLEICDENQLLLIDLPFNEVLQTLQARRPPPPDSLFAGVEASAARVQQVNAELSIALQSARANLAALRRTLGKF